MPVIPKAYHMIPVGSGVEVSPECLLVAWQEVGPGYVNELQKCLC